MNKTCASVFADVSRFWNTSDPRNYYCGDLVRNSCDGLCQDSSTGARDFMNWNTHVCRDYLNTYNPLNHKQEFYRHWTDLDSLSDLAYQGLFPWKWQVRNETRSTNNSTTTQTDCASTPAELGSFAAINVIVLLVSILLSRRTFVERITFGRCGKAGSSMWILTGFLSFILSVAANFVNALLLNHTPGYGHVPIGSLVLLWSTRPRMAWIMILLVNVQSEDSEYLGSAASAALSETLQQLVGLTYVGKTANYARVNGLFSTSRLAHIPHAYHATLMYRGSVLVLVSVGFALISLLVIMRKMRNQIFSMLGFGKKKDVSGQQNEMLLSDYSSSSRQQSSLPKTLQKMHLEQDHIGLVYRMAIYMVPLFIGQWLFWAGFVNLSGDLYCPPSIWRMMGVWSGFSSLGLLFGAAG
ncbi:hypothetical protein PV08_06980 [Exophiala spinifera]|uniref:Uncharacterized protein n=1 Tax=Exophiala spinifera TaxID=91928 RepID=A0A0D2BSG9_9EURO|nr:uncharacterized protein PV08_06980 [Exophiala spinifera]KIW14199.1 hypothetical protein PV08_06980 [Exophiala spinifera]